MATKAQEAAQKAGVEMADAFLNDAMLPTYTEVVAALNAALTALSNASPAKAADWPAHEAAEKTGLLLVKQIA